MSVVYAVGFMQMTPQLFLNYKYKSVDHLPWNALIYKAMNTFIDDLFGAQHAVMTQAWDEMA